MPDIRDAIMGDLVGSPSPEATPSPEPTPAAPVQETAPVADPAAPVVEAPAPQPVEDEELTFPDDDAPVEELEAPKEETPAPEETPAKVYVKTLEDLKTAIGSADNFDKALEDLEYATLRTPRGQKMKESYQLVRDYEQETGNKVNKETLDAAFSAKENLDELLYDFRSENPERITSFFSEMLGKDQSGKPSLDPKAMKAIELLPSVLAQEGYVDGYKVLARSVMTDYMEAAYAQAEQVTDDKTKKFYQNLGRFLEADLTGKWRELGGQPQEQAAPVRDPEKEAVQRRLRELEQEQKNRAQQDRASYKNTIGQNIGSSVSKDIEYAFSKEIKSLQEQGRPNTAKGIIKTFSDDVHKEVMASDIFQRQYKRLADRAMQTLDPNDADAVVTAYRQRARAIIKKLYPEYRKEHSVQQATESEKRRIQEEAARKTGPTSPGAVAPPTQTQRSQGPVNKEADLRAQIQRDMMALQ